MADWGSNGGLTGIITGPNDSDAADAILRFNVIGWDYAHGADVVRRIGTAIASDDVPSPPDQTRWASVRYRFSSGKVAGHGKLNTSKAPLPQVWEGYKSNAVFQIDTGMTVTYPVQITSFTSEVDQKTKDTWDVAFTAEMCGPPVFSGLGTLLAPSAPSQFDIKLYKGAITVDPAAVPLGSAPTTVYIDFWGLDDDTDATTVDRLAAVIAAASAPYPNLKQMPAQINKDSVDGGVITLQWDFTDTNDKAVNPDFLCANDPNEVESQSSAAILSTDGTDSPAAPDLADADVLQVREITKLNDNAYKTKDTYGLLDTTEKISFPETQLSLSPIGLDDEGSEVQIYDPTVGVVPPIVILSVNSSGQISSPIIIYPSGNLPSNIAATVKGGGGSSGTLTLTRGTVNGVTNALSACTVNATGSGYTSAPTVNFTGDGLLNPATIRTSSATYPKNLKATMGMPVKINRKKSKLTWKFASRDAIDEFQLGSPFRPHTQTKTNQSGIGSTGERALVDCVPPSTITDANSKTLYMTDLIAHPVVTDENRATLRTLYRALYGMLTTADEIVYRGQSVSGSLETMPIGDEPNVWISVVSTSDSLETIAASMDAALKDDQFIRTWSARKLNPGIAVERFEAINDDLLVFYGVPRTEDKFSGCDSTGAYCNVVDFRTRDSSTVEVLLGGYNIPYRRRTIVLRRRYYTSDSVDDVLFDSLLAYTNSSSMPSTFLGQSYIQFDGSKLRANWQREGDGGHTYVVDHYFTSSNYPFVYPRIHPGTRLVTTASVSARGSYAITSIDTELVTDFTLTDDFNSDFLS